MKFEKIVLSLAVASLILAVHSAAVGALVKKSTDAATSTSKKSRKNLKNERAQRTNKKKVIRVSEFTNSDDIESELTQFEVAAVSTSLTTSQSRRAARPEARVSTVVETPAQESSFNGEVGFRLGNDSNLDPDKLGVKSTFYQVEPKLSFKSGAWSGQFGAAMRDYADQETSAIHRKSEAGVTIAYEAKISSVTTSTTTLGATYSDEMFPDFIGNTAYTPDDVGMQMRNAGAKFEQKIGMDFGSIKTEIGGSYKYTDWMNKDTDSTDELIDRQVFERDNGESSGFASVTFVTATFLDISLKPSVTHQRYDERQSKLPNGQAGGTTITSPNMEFITTQAALDLNFKFGKSNITPVALIGQVSDEALGAEDRSFYGFGLSSTLVIDESTSLTLTPSVMYKKINYDNWNFDINENAQNSLTDKRLETEVSAGVDASIKLAKNLKLSAGYSIVREKSNKIDSSENYRQEVVSSALTFLF